jgi:hypothetical protein
MDVVISVQYLATFDSAGTITSLYVTRVTLPPCAVASGSLEALNNAATTGSLCPTSGFVNAQTTMLIGSGSAFDLGNDVTVDHFCVSLVAANLQISTLSSSCVGNTFGATVRFNSTTVIIVVQYHATLDSAGNITGLSVTRLPPCAIASGSLEALNKAAPSGIKGCPPIGFMNSMSMIGSGSAIDLGDDVTVDHFCRLHLPANVQVLSSSCAGNFLGTVCKF